tara:strand:- start:2821 stop:3252 length:432 start_codon:yes stop_codon:yes gene_type:complete
MRLLIVAVLLMIGGAAHGVPVVPSFSQGSMTSRTETRSSVTEVINSMDYSTGYSWSASGHNVKSNTGSLSAGTGTTSSSVGDGISAEWTNMNMSNKPTWSIVNPGEGFSLVETYHGPGLSNQTIIQRTTEVESITETTSVFQR